MKKTEKPVQPDMSYTMRIDGITGSGEGVASVDGFKVFVDRAVPNDLVEARITKVKNNYATAEIERIIEPSPKRVEPVCPYAESCGGCPYIHISYDEQLKIKEEAVYDALVRKGKLDVKILPIIGGEEYNYRNKAQFKIDKTGLGFYKKRSHAIIPVDFCELQSEAINEMIPVLERIIAQYDIPIYNENTHSGLLRGILVRSNRDGEIMIVFIINGRKFPDAAQIVESLEPYKNIVEIYINIHDDKGNSVLGEDSSLLYKRYPGDYIGFSEDISDLEYFISPGSFFQVNSSQTEVLYDIVTDYADLKDGEILFDLYCGTGTIGIYVIKKSGVDARLVGVERNREAAMDARVNADLNEVRKAVFHNGRVERITRRLKEKPNCIILDPPRKGCDRSFLELLLELRAPRIVYVSCNPTTLARDLNVLKDQYTIVKVQPVDMFPQTGHVETVCLLKLKGEEDGT